MRDRGPRPTQSGGEDRGSRLPDWAVAVLLVEAIALLIGLAMPITPSKTGSTWSPAQLFWPDPSYLEEVAVYFVMGNLLMLVIGLVAWLYSKLSRSC